MLVTRPRPSISGEWLTAAAFLAATLVVGFLVVRELRVVPQAISQLSQPPTATSTAVPSDAVSVPALMLGSTNEIHVGDRVDDAIRRLGRESTFIKTVIERGPLGPREVRSYELAGTKFVLVLEPFERQGAPRVAAIYLQ